MELIKTITECLADSADEPVIKPDRDGHLIPGEGRRILLLDDLRVSEG